MWREGGGELEERMRSRENDGEEWYRVNKYISARDMRGEVGETEVEQVMQKDGEKGGGRDREAADERESRRWGKHREEERRKETPESRKEWWEEGWGTREERHGDEMRGAGKAKEVQKALAAIELNLQSYIYIYILISKRCIYLYFIILNNQYIKFSF